MIALTAAAVSLALLAPAAASAEPGRYAVLVGSNDGGAGRPRLWYAEKDAERFSHTLVELGDFPEDHVVLLRGARVAQVRDALRSTEAQLAAARRSGRHTLLVFYYSGHAGSDGLELGDEKLSFDELRATIAGASADAKVAIVDACEAGLLTQVKGASAAPALDFPLPQGEEVRGTAFVASTAVGEAAQESAAIGGSFFTHHLEVALRGAGDADGDGLVTLAEAFRYTAAQTLAGTVTTATGAQHATYEMKMSGRGDVVLSDLRRADARLTLPRDPGAAFTVRGPMSILAEVAGRERPITLALPAGHYRVERRSPEGRAGADLDLERGATQQLPPLSPTRYELARSKGGPKPGLLFAGAGVGTLALSNFGVAPSFDVGVRKEFGPFGLRIRLDYLGKSVDDAGLHYDAWYVGGAVAGLYPLNASRILVEVGPQLGFGYAWQRLSSNRKSFGSGVLTMGAAAMATAPVGPLRIGLDLGLGVQGLRINDSLSVGPAVSLSLLALWGF